MGADTAQAAGRRPRRAYRAAQSADGLDGFGAGASPRAALTHRAQTRTMQATHPAATRTTMTPTQDT